MGIRASCFAAVLCCVPLASDAQTAAPATRPSVWTELVEVPENEADVRGFLFAVCREDADAGQAVVVRLTTRGTMTPGFDFVAPPRRLVMPPRVSVVHVRIPIIDDGEGEGPETIELIATVERAASPTTRATTAPGTAEGRP